MKMNVSCGPQRLKQKDKLGGYILGNSFCPKCITKNISHTISVFVSYIFFLFAISYPSFVFFFVLLQTERLLSRAMCFL